MSALLKKNQGISPLATRDGKQEDKQLEKPTIPLKNFPLHEAKI